MRKSFRTLLTIMLALAFICAMTVPVLAKEFRDLVIHKPAAGSTWYKGDKIPMDVETETLDADYLNKFTLKLCPKNSTKTVWTKASPKEEIYYYKTTLPSKSIAPGAYKLTVTLNAKYNSEENDLSHEYSLSRAITIKELKAPTKLKVKAGKKKVTIKYKKAKGAQKYEIYRSKKKSKGYKKRTTTTKAKFVDKKVKKGKKYYYKVRSVRTKYGTVKSKFTKPKRSKKVKR